MSKPFAKQFYNSQAWQACRDAYISERFKADGGLCERCHKETGREVHHKILLNPDNIHDPDVSLNHSNLQLLCRDCHFAVHRELILENFKRKSHTRILNERGLYFDDTGQLRTMEPIVVTGPPGAGKTAYVMSHRDPTDLIVDLDQIEMALGININSPADNLLGLALAVREYIYSLIEKRDAIIDCKHVWIVATLPRRADRAAIISRLNAAHVSLRIPSEECRKRILEDETRKDKQLHIAIMEKYFENYEPD